MARIGLCMIVKNESHVIERCLDSVHPLIDYALIVDTGSTDGTQDLVRAYLARNDLPGAVLQEHWRDFAYNRNFALSELRRHEKIEYALMIDADDRIVLEDGFDPDHFRSGLQHDMYDVRIDHGATSYLRAQICRNNLAFSYKGVLHEYLEGPPGPLTRSTLTGFHILFGGDGARSRNMSKYKEDSAVLERALLAEKDPYLVARYIFYLAQSYRDCGEKEKAHEAYLHRAELGYWQEEIFISLLAAGKLMAELGYAFSDVISMFERATASLPTRAEALHAAAKYCRDQENYEMGYVLALRGLKIAQPQHGLFLEPWIYEYGLLDELAVNAFWVGRYHDSSIACEIVLRRPSIDAKTRARVIGNRNLVRSRLGERQNLRAGGLDHECPKAVIVTPYCREAPETLKRCIESVRAQSLPADHILVADGHPQDWIDNEGVRHIRLDNSSGDFGDTPRGIGAMLAGMSRSLLKLAKRALLWVALRCLRLLGKSRVVGLLLVVYGSGARACDRQWSRKKLTGAGALDKRRKLMDEWAAFCEPALEPTDAGRADQAQAAAPCRALSAVLDHDQVARIKTNDLWSR